MQTLQLVVFCVWVQALVLEGINGNPYFLGSYPMKKPANTEDALGDPIIWIRSLRQRLEARAENASCAQYIQFTTHQRKFMGKNDTNTVKLGRRGKPFILANLRCNINSTSNNSNPMAIVLKKSCENESYNYNMIGARASLTFFCFVTSPTRERLSIAIVKWPTSLHDRYQCRPN